MTSDTVDVAALFREHHVALHRYLVRLTGDEATAADAVQHAFLRLMESPPDHGGVRTWLFTVASNFVRDRLRSSRRRRELLSERPERVPVGDAGPDPDRLLERREAEARVRAALDTLRPRDRTILLMREEGFTHREIAEAVGTTPGSVGTMIARALRAAREALDADAPEEDGS